MTRNEAIEILRKHNEWRRYDGSLGEGPEMLNPVEVGEAIDTAIKELSNSVSLDDYIAGLSVCEKRVRREVVEELGCRDIAVVRETAYKLGYIDGKEDALSGFPGWRKTGIDIGNAYVDVSGLSDHDMIRRNGLYISMLDLDKLPITKDV